MSLKASRYTRPVPDRIRKSSASAAPPNPSQNPTRAARASTPPAGPSRPGDGFDPASAPKQALAARADVGQGLAGIPSPSAQDLFGGPGVASPAAPNLVAHGGRVLDAPVVAPIYYGDYWTTPAGQADKAANDGFAQDFGKSSMRGVLAQYGSAGPTFGGSAVQASNGAVTQLGAADVQKIVQQQLDAGALKKTAECIYTVMLPPGAVLVDDQGDSSKAGLGGYHGSFVAKDGSTVYYAAIAYSDAQNGINFDGVSRDALSITESHEWAEAATDPDVAVAAANNDLTKLGYYDENLGEIGDLAMTQLQDPTKVFQKVDGYTQQLEWSQRDHQYETSSSEEVADAIAQSFAGASAADLARSPKWASATELDCLRQMAAADQANDPKAAIEAALVGVAKSQGTFHTFFWNELAQRIPQVAQTNVPELVADANALSANAPTRFPIDQVQEMAGQLALGNGWRTGPAAAKYASMSASDCLLAAERDSANPTQVVADALFGLQKSPQPYTAKKLSTLLAGALAQSPDSLLSRLAPSAQAYADGLASPAVDPATVLDEAGSAIFGAGWGPSSLAPYAKLSAADCLLQANAASDPHVAAQLLVAGLSKDSDPFVSKQLWTALGQGVGKISDNPALSALAPQIQSYLTSLPALSLTDPEAVRSDALQVAFGSQGAARIAQPPYSTASASDCLLLADQALDAKDPQGALLAELAGLGKQPDDYLRAVLWEDAAKNLATLTGNPAAQALLPFVQSLAQSQPGRAPTDPAGLRAAVTEMLFGSHPPDPSQPPYAAMNAADCAQAAAQATDPTRKATYALIGLDKNPGPVALRHCWDQLNQAMPGLAQIHPDLGALAQPVQSYLDTIPSIDDSLDGLVNAAIGVSATNYLANSPYIYQSRFPRTWFLVQADQAAASGDAKTAVGLYGTALLQDPKDAHTWNRLGQAMDALHDPNLGDVCREKASELGTHSTSPGAVSADQMQQAANAGYLAAAGLPATDVLSRIAFGEARALFQGQANSPAAWVNLAASLSNQGQPQAAAQVEQVAASLRSHPLASAPSWTFPAPAVGQADVNGLATTLYTGMPKLPSTPGPDYQAAVLALFQGSGDDPAAWDKVATLCPDPAIGEQAQQMADSLRAHPLAISASAPGPTLPGAPRLPPSQVLDDVTQQLFQQTAAQFVSQIQLWDLTMPDWSTTKYGYLQPDQYLAVAQQLKASAQNLSGDQATMRNAEARNVLLMALQKDPTSKQAWALLQSWEFRAPTQVGQEIQGVLAQLGSP